MYAYFRKYFYEFAEIYSPGMFFTQSFFSRPNIIIQESRAAMSDFVPS